MRGWLDRVRRRPSEAEFVEEVQSHLAHAIDEHVDRGVDPEEARYLALRTFGNVTRHLERFRETSPGFLLETVGQDARYGWRALWRAPVLTLVIVLSLALGIGANAAVYTVAHAVLLQPLRLPEANRMFVLRQENHQLASMPALTQDELEQVVQAAGTLGTAGPWSEWSVTMRVGDTPATEMVLFASEGATRAFGVQPQIGRWPTDEEYRSGAPVAVITNRLWRQHGAEPGVLGRRIRLGARRPSGFADVEFTVIGVAPPSLHGRFVGIPWAAVMPFQSLEVVSPGSISKASVFWVGMLGRLAPGQSMEQAARQVEGWKLSPWGPKAVPRRIELVPAADAALPVERRTLLAQALGWLSALAALVLLLGCTNLASAMLARSAARRHELAMRVSLGARRSRLVRLLAIEYLLLGLLSAAAALVVSQVMVRAFPAALALGRKWLVIPVEVPLDLTASVMIVAAALGLASCVVFGLAPAVRYTRVDPMAALRGGAQGWRTAPGRSRRFLLGAQVAASSLLLVGVLLLRAAVADGTSMDHGLVQRGPVVYARVQFVRAADDAAVAGLRRTFIERLASHPSFVSAAFTSSPEPFGPLAVGDRIAADGVERVPESRELARNMTGGRVLAEFVDATYRETVGLPLLYGRDLTPQDGSSGEPGVLVNDDLARQFWPAGDAIGGQIRVHLFGQGWAPSSGSARIVGVVGNARYDVRHGTGPCVYFLNDGTRTSGVYVRLRPDARNGTAWVREVLHGVQPDDPPPLVLSRDEYVEAELAAERTLLEIVSWFATVAVALSLVGVYGIASDTVTRRTREIAIRLALGAPLRLVVTLATRSALAPAIAGLTAGLAAAAFGASAIHGFVFGLEPFHPAAYGAAALLILTIACVAAWWPARRAVRIPPAESLRAE